MKVHDYEIQRVIKEIMTQINFKATYSYLELLAHPDMPDTDIEDLKFEASQLLYKTFIDAMDLDGAGCYNFSTNFKATFLNDEMHLDTILAWNVTDVHKIGDLIRGK